MTETNQMNVKYPEIEVELSGQDGNAFTLLGSVSRSLRRAKVSDAEVAKFMHDATSGDYDQLLRTCMQWVTVA